MLVKKIDPIGLPVGAVRQKLVPRRDEETLGGVQLELQLRPFVHVAGPVDAHVAARFGQVVGLVILQAVGADHGVAAAQLGIAFKHRIQVGAATDAVTGQEERLAAAHRRRNLLLQARAHLKNERRLRGLLRLRCLCRLCHSHLHKRGQHRLHQKTFFQHRTGARQQGGQHRKGGGAGRGGAGRRGGYRGQGAGLCRMDYP